MRSRWTILAALFVARAAFAFQFGSVGAVAPQLSRSLGVSLADVGILIGIYFAPGVLLALSCTAIGSRPIDRLSGNETTGHQSAAVASISNALQALALGNFKGKSWHLARIPRGNHGVPF